MTKKQQIIFFIALAGHGICLCILFLFFFNKLAIAAVFLSLILVILYFFFQKQNNISSPLELATLFVEGLRLQKYGPPISSVEDASARPLMTALNNLAKEIENKNMTISKLEKLRMEFVANVSHELKTPLTSIRGYTETLLAGALRDPQVSEQFLKRIDQNSEKLSALISDLLDLSRLESQPSEIHWTQFPSQFMQERLENVFFPVLTRTGHKLLVKFEDEVWEGDKKKLEQVFFNLIDNAIKHTPFGTQIEFKQKRENREMIYEIKDNGPGIDAGHLPRIFERFYRVDSARSRETGGTGLGLSIVKHIVLAHQGAISVESQVGSGTRFLLRIPVRGLEAIL